ncbi:unnamed protein product [Protopolystoma xenopodis]|uniref:STI1 domain-containing protein n=1 Tax=Protopolystoma xenopodis TaxID=117903 RepID=A0A3S4ZYI8_9PLAT|nr:unnamed protein product [Protopolystoma xenopodis]
MRELVERNPEVGQMLRNPDLLRQSLEIARNPSLMQEMVRNYDRALSNLESLPGGMQHLQRIFQDIQEPMMDAVRTMGGANDNPFADLASGGTHSRSTNSDQRQAAPSNEPMPNPWAVNSSNNEARPGIAGGTMAGSRTVGGDPMQNMLRQLASRPELMANAFQLLSCARTSSYSRD